MGLIIAGTVLGGRLASFDLLQLVWQASWLVQLVILLLAAASVVSWAAIVFKWRELNAAEQDSEAFLETYHEGSWDASYEAARNLDRSPLAAIFLMTHAELKRFAKYRGRSGGGEPAEELLQRTVARQISWVTAQESLRLESRLPLLATIGSATPFIGLFGTVVGIINAFTGIGASGSASLAVVAPGIAEALIATAIGLFAAIPATIFYNIFVSRLRDLQEAIRLFASELEADVLRFGETQAAPARAVEG
jgi:biopolymer transport protein TolQ